MGVWRSLLHGFVYGDHHLLHRVGAQAVVVVQRDVAHLHQPGRLAQLARPAHVAGDAVYLCLVAAGTSTRAKSNPVWETKE